MQKANGAQEAQPEPILVALSLTEAVPGTTATYGESEEVPGLSVSVGVGNGKPDSPLMVLIQGLPDSGREGLYREKLPNGFAPYHIVQATLSDGDVYRLDTSEFSRPLPGEIEIMITDGIGQPGSTCVLILDAFDDVAGEAEEDTVVSAAPTQETVPNMES